MSLMKSLNFFALFALCISLPLSAQQNPRPFVPVVEEIIQLMEQHHYNPAELQGEEYQQVVLQMQTLGQQATSTDEFVDRFNEIWKNGPFSHVSVSKAQQSAAELADHLDSMQVGEGGSQLTWHSKTAVLTINTMMGLDTIERINKAFGEIVQNQAGHLIIDLRQNGGGAFAVKPLVGHLIDEPMDAGVFVSQPWNARFQKPPANEDIQNVDPWQGWSIRAFWRDAQNNALIRIQFQPVKPYFAGPVYVLQSHSTASAAELAIDALSGLDNVTLVGEITAGQMLSQKMYDLSQGLHLFLPIADYYAVNTGRIEGQGVRPDIEIDAGEAMEMVLSLVDQ
jgi:carboxyl-terminal processing protease